MPRRDLPRSLNHSLPRKAVLVACALLTGCAEDEPPEDSAARCDADVAMSISDENLSFRDLDFPAPSCNYVVDLAVAVDSRFLAHVDGGGGEVQGAEAKVVELVGYLDDLYAPLQIQFRISEIYVSESLGTDASPVGTSADTITQTVTSTWADAHLTSEYDMAIYMTGDDLSFAWAWGGANSSMLCGSNRYSASIISYTSRQTAQIMAHEMGHNFGASHRSGSGWIMNPTIFASSDEWAPETADVILSGIRHSACVELECPPPPPPPPIFTDDPNLDIGSGDVVIFTDVTATDVQVIDSPWEFP